MDTPTPSDSQTPASRRLGRGPLAGAVMAAVLMGATALGATTLASAQDSPTPSAPTTVAEVETTEDSETVEDDGGEAHSHEHTHEGGAEAHDHEDDWDHDHDEDWDEDAWDDDWDIEISAEDEAVFDRFDTCLADNGWSDEAFEELDKTEDSGADIDEATIDSIDAAFETCDPILDDLSPELQELKEEWDEDDDDYEEFSAEDEAVLDRLEDCVVAGLGGDEDKVDEMMEAREYGKASAEDIAAVDAAVDGCSDILGELGPDARAMVDEFLD